jgi:hypothetical protein
MDAGPLTRRQCLALALYAGLGPTVLSHARASFGAGSRAGLDAWLGARLFPEGEPAELELLSGIVASHLAAGGELARVDTALRNGLLSDPFKYSSADHLDEALAPLLGDFLKRSSLLQSALGLPKGFKLEASCSLSSLKLR